MPVVETSSYRPPWWLKNAHAQTIWPALVRKVSPLAWQRERLELADGDFLDLDWARSGARRLVVITHGLEGTSRRTYMVGMARAFLRRGWDALAWNFRGCSGGPNRLCRSYHSGATEDLAAVIAHATRGGGYDRVAVVGFSLGGNLTLKFLGELGAAPGLICGGTGVSVPCDLQAAALRMAGPDCARYMRRFLADMGDKMRAKARQFPGRIELAPLHGMTTFREFDDAYTAPLHGFRDAVDYWTRCSAKQFLPQVRVPTLIVSALDDPFLAPECFPYAEAAASRWVTLDAPPLGGHVGFVSPGGEYWSERRTAEFLTSAAEARHG